MRYDGGHKRNHCIMDLLTVYFDWFPVCPEVGAGLGVPRPPIRLVTREGGIRALGIENAEVDVTLALQSYAQEVSDQFVGISGYVFKSRSPSCGLSDVDLFNTKGRLTGTSMGIYAAQVRTLFPQLPLIDEISLADAVLRDAFVRRVHDYLSPQKNNP